MTQPAGEQADTRVYRAEGAGVSLLVRELGSGPPLVVLHGGPGAEHDYLLASFAVLADEYRLHFYDQRGGGGSLTPRPSRIRWRDHVDDLEALRQRWSIERVAIVGYSWGGLLALLYAVMHPDRVRALALVAPAAGWGDYHRRFKEEFSRRSNSEVVRRVRTELEASGLAVRDPGAYRQRRFELSVAAYFRDPLDAVEVPAFSVQLQAQQATWTSLRGFGPGLRRRLGALQVPALILHGRHDPIPMAWAEELASVMPRARLAVLEKSGHVPYLEEPERLFGEIRRFLRQELRR
jgi:proline iminopeptidase